MLAPPSETAPLTTTWSYPVPAVVPAIWTAKCAPEVKVRSPVWMVPGLLPGASVPPARITTAPVVPWPPSVAPLCTSTAEPAIDPSTISVPALTLVPPT